MSGMKNMQAASVAGLQCFLTQVLSVPDVPEKPLVYIKRARAHEALSKDGVVRKNAKKRYRDYEKNLLRHF